MQSYILSYAILVSHAAGGKRSPPFNAHESPQGVSLVVGVRNLLRHNCFARISAKISVEIWKEKPTVHFARTFIAEAYQDAVVSVSRNGNYYVLGV